MYETHITITGAIVQSMTNNKKCHWSILPLTWKAMTMAEATYVYTITNIVECYKPIIYSHHEPQKFYSIKEVHYFNSIQFGHATKQSYKLINNGTATSLIEIVKERKNCNYFLATTWTNSNSILFIPLVFFFFFFETFHWC